MVVMGGRKRRCTKGNYSGIHLGLLARQGTINNIDRHESNTSTNGINVLDASSVWTNRARDKEARWGDN